MIDLSASQHQRASASRKPRLTHNRKLSLAVTLAMTSLVVCGCQPDIATVSGTVTYRDEPIPVGNVTFFAADNRVVFIPINEDGTYFLDRVPVGEVQITVETPSVQLPGPGEPPIPASLMTPAYKYPNVRIPAHYKDRRTSGLRLDVRPGEQTFDIRLEDADESP